MQTRNSLPEKTRIQVASLLQKSLAESIDLTLQLKHAHWNVKGPCFIALHLLFDELAEESEKHSDLVAERIAQLGGIAEGALQTVTRRSRLPEYPIQAHSGIDHVIALSHSLAYHGEAVRQSIELAAELEDPVTADILTEISRAVDGFLWKVEAHVQAGDHVAAVRSA